MGRGGLHAGNAAPDFEEVLGSVFMLGGGGRVVGGDEGEFAGGEVLPEFVDVGAGYGGCTRSTRGWQRPRRSRSWQLSVR